VIVEVKVESGKVSYLIRLASLSVENANEKPFWAAWGLRKSYRGGCGSRVIAVVVGVKLLRWLWK